MDIMFLLGTMLTVTGLFSIQGDVPFLIALGLHKYGLLLFIIGSLVQMLAFHFVYKKMKSLNRSEETARLIAW